MGRLLFMTFFGKERFDHQHVHPHESPATMWVPLAVLAVLSVVGGLIPIPEIVTHFTGGEHVPHAPLVMLVLASGLAFGGLGIAWYAYVREPSIPEQAADAAPGVYAFLRDKWRVDELYDATVVRLVFAAADAGARFFDPRIVDGAVNGLGALFAELSATWRRLQTGNLQHYALSFVVGALALLGWYVVR
jgi:NADH-quinone oxidoreductase subunit L